VRRGPEANDTSVRDPAGAARDRLDSQTHQDQRMNSRTNKLTALVVAAALTAATSASGAGVDNKMLSNEADGTNWASYGRTFSENHYSPLNEINDGNVSRLGLAWYYDVPPMASVFSAPLAVNGVLYFATGYSVIHAMDAQTGKLLWQYDPEVPTAAGQKLRGGWGIRGIAFWGDRVLTGTQDGRLIALDAKSGKLLWSVMTIESNDGRYITGPPWVFNGKVVIGFGGADFNAVRGYVTAYDITTGKKLWRFYTVPGNPKDGFENKAMEMAAKTWNGEWWKYGGGGATVWSAMAYDPKFNRLYLGTGNGSPWNQKIRSPGGGDNLFVCSIVALNADTGEYAWHYQVNPGETWDYNAAMDIELATLEINGKQRPVILHAPKNGFFYIIDREAGKLLSAEKFGKVTWAERIDLATGRPVENPAARFPDGKPFLMYPGPIGAHNVQAMSFNPKTRLTYIPATELASIYSDPADLDVKTWQPKPGMFINNGIGRPPANMSVPPGRSWLLAWDAEKQKAAWSVPLNGFINGGTATTAGNLVLQGQVTGQFTAYAADNGKPLWSFDAQTGIATQPITYKAGGKQYITAIAGWRGMGGANGLKQEWDYYTQPRRVLTFTLDGKAKLPPFEAVRREFVEDPGFTVDPAKAAVGAAIVNSQCLLCHGPALNSGGTAPDLRASPLVTSKEALSAVLHDGILVPRGMPRFEEFTPEQIEGLQHYIRQRAREAIAAMNAAAAKPN
jgi:quinohemoprotein ethanol dehydrogenase